MDYQSSCSFIHQHFLQYDCIIQLCLTVNIYFSNIENILSRTNLFERDFSAIDRMIISNNIVNYTKFTK